MANVRALPRITNVTYRLARRTFRHPSSGQFAGQPTTVVRTGRSWWEGTLTVGAIEDGEVGGPVLDVGDKIEVPLGVFGKTARGDRALGIRIASATAEGWTLTGELPDDVGVGDFLRAGAGRLVRIESMDSRMRVSPEVSNASGAIVQVRSVLAEVTSFPTVGRSGTRVHPEMTYEWRYIE